MRVTVEVEGMYVTSMDAEERLSDGTVGEGQEGTGDHQQFQICGLSRRAAGGWDGSWRAAPHCTASTRRKSQTPWYGRKGT